MLSIISPNLFSRIAYADLSDAVSILWVRKERQEETTTYAKQKSPKSYDFEDFWHAVRDSNPRPSGP